MFNRNWVGAGRGQVNNSTISALGEVNGINACSAINNVFQRAIRKCIGVYRVIAAAADKRIDAVGSSRIFPRFQAALAEYLVT